MILEPARSEDIPVWYPFVLSAILLMYDDATNWHTMRMVWRRTRTCRMEGVGPFILRNVDGWRERAVAVVPYCSSEPLGRLCNVPPR